MRNFIKHCIFGIHVTNQKSTLKKIIKATNHAIELIVAFPDSGVVVDNTSERLVRKYLVLDNFSLYYVVHSESIEILFFFDSRENPDKLTF